MELMLSTDFSIKEIAEAVGYSDLSYFHRVFKKYHGITPKAQRNLRHQ
jgi:YesN/AraC family two-component response regulator